MDIKPAGTRESSVRKPTGGSEPEADEGVSVRPAPFGRLGAADLTDAEIIRLALADKPHGKVTGTALRKDFGVGPNRAARIRDSIVRRRLAARLAARMREEVEARQAAENHEVAASALPLDAALAVRGRQ